VQGRAADLDFVARAAVGRLGARVPPKKKNLTKVTRRSSWKLNFKTGFRCDFCLAALDVGGMREQHSFFIFIITL